MAESETYRLTRKERDTLREAVATQWRARNDDAMADQSEMPRLDAMRGVLKELDYAADSPNVIVCRFDDLERREALVAVDVEFAQMRTAATNRESSWHVRTLEGLQRKLTGATS